MKKIKQIVFVSVLSTSVFSTPMTDAMVEFSMQQMEEDGMFTQMSDISGLKVSVLEDAYRASLTTCLNEFPIEEEMDDVVLDTCFSENLTSHLNISSQTLELWAAQVDQQDHQSVSKIEQKILDIEEKIESFDLKGEMSEQDEEELIALHEQLVQLYLEQSQEFLELMSNVDSK